MAGEGPDTTTGGLSAGDNHAQNTSEQLQPNFVSPETMASASPYVFTSSAADGEGQGEPKKTKKKKNKKKKTKGSATTTTATATTPAMPTAASSNVNAAPPSLFGGPPAATSTPAASATTTHSRATTNASTWVASPDGEGDVLFTFPNDDGPLIRKPTLLVKSSVLASASPVFRAMFGPHFSEGQNLSKHNKTNPKKISLPEDRASSVRVICFVLHDNENHEGLCCIGCLFSYAEVLDKYDLKKKMTHKSEEWVKKMVLEARERNYSGPDDRELLGVAYVLEAPRAFFHICRDMILYEEVGFEDMSDQAVPASILLAMESTRTETVHKLPDMVRSRILRWIDMSDGNMSDDCDCDQNCGAILACTFGMGLNDILEPEDWDDTIASFFDYWLHATRPSTVKRLRTFARELGVCTACRSAPSLVDCLVELEADLKRWYDSIEVPCLDCRKGDDEHAECPSGSSKEDDYWN
ncbi:hypothetical protein DBV05_g1267 [Lasiodiplodia theobromae]|uniref:BTB domain-containing protein n=1 Tax=Lasiodiplodia theobromae TaxID=45133 RepID=A0A5N5DR15_9PEZI|nr:hypothetical protein DBV05_g1267 [Lasiodiplodia theobromae]